ncbi:MAG: response regulator [Proteobacteria bacterium]|nr:response regulator [Pseudomonadota bacterium]
MNILVVDDSALMRKTIRKELEAIGYEVEEAEDGSEALRKLFRLKNKIDLVTMDVEMPKLDGFKTCEILQTDKYEEIFKAKSGKKIPIVFITSNDTLEDRIRGFELGATEFISKSFIEAELASTIDKILKPSERLKGFCALVVDDSATYRRIVVDCMERQGVAVDEAGNGKIAYRTLVASPQKYDMIITDLSMPEMDGLELTRKIRTELGLTDTPILMLSAISERATQIELFKAGINDYLVKPFIQEELLARLKVHLETIWYNKRLKENLKELKKSREAILKSDNERKELLHVLCHDLANPLSSISSIMELMEVVPDAEEFKELVMLSANNGLEIIDLVRKMRALEENKLDWDLVDINLKEALDESTRVLGRRFADKAIELEIDIDDDMTVNVEPTSFKSSVLNNILTNAVKFSERNSKITIIGKKSGQAISITIRDYGIGMPKRLLQDVFDVNKATSRIGTEGEAGTGFGMPLVKKFVNAYQGDIRIESREKTVSPTNHGTEVRIVLKSTI